VRLLLDENFPLRLVRRLRQENFEVEHIILLGQRGAADRAILNRLDAEETLFLTNDQEFLEAPPTRSPIIVSQVTQSLSIAARVEIWLRAIQEYGKRERQERGRGGRCARELRLKQFASRPCLLASPLELGETLLLAGDLLEDRVSCAGHVRPRSAGSVKGLVASEIPARSVVGVVASLPPPIQRCC
jgi:predicted nuclease of predicted toxin-antitoxin system